MYDGLTTLSGYLKPYGVMDIMYAYMLHKKSFIRNDYLRVSTFKDDIRALFDQDGGAASTSFALLPHLTGPVFFDIKAVLNPEKPMFNYNSCTQEIYDRGYRGAWIIPLLAAELHGYGFLMLFQDSHPKAPQIDIQSLEKFSALYHNAMKTHKQMARYFRLTEKQCQAIKGVAEGKTAADLAEKLGISERAVELRLQDVRKKLYARTTSEAVYKAVVYAILPNCITDDESS